MESRLIYSIQVPGNSLELMMGGRSSYEDDKMIEDTVRNLLKIGEENDSKCAQKVKSEGLMLTPLM
jgi:hypothetical protein